MQKFLLFSHHLAKQRSISAIGLERIKMRNQHQVSIVSPTERRSAKKTYLIHKRNCQILKIKTGNIQKTKFRRLPKDMCTIQPVINHLQRKRISK